MGNGERLRASLRAPVEWMGAALASPNTPPPPVASRPFSARSNSRWESDARLVRSRATDETLPPPGARVIDARVVVRRGGARRYHAGPTVHRPCGAATRQADPDLGHGRSQGE